MKKEISFNLNWFLAILLTGFSPLFLKVFETEWWVILGVVAAFWVYSKYKNIRWLILVLLFFLNLYLNRLLTVGNGGSLLSFDREQSYYQYPGIRESIIRYFQEGLWAPYPIRKLIYGQYLLFTPWIFSVLKLLSPTFWIKMLGFAGFLMLILGIDQELKERKKEFFVKLIWVLIVLLSSAMRVIGDSRTFLFLGLPAIACFFVSGLRNPLFAKYKLIVLGLFLFDLILR